MTTSRQDIIKALQADTDSRKEALNSLHEARNAGEGTNLTDHAIQGLVSAIAENNEALKSNAERLTNLRAIDANETAADEARSRSNVPEAQPAFVGGSLRSLLSGETDRIELEGRAMSTVGAGVGAEHVVQTPSNRLHTVMETASALLGAGNIFDTGGDYSDFVLPKITGSGGPANSELAEGGTITGDELDTGRDTLKAWRYSGIVEVSNQFLGTAIIPVEKMVTDGLGRRLAKAFGPRLAIGTGTAQPQGITVGAGLGITAASATAITSDELMNLVFSVAAENRAAYACSFVMADATWAAISKLKGSDLQYLIGDLSNGAELRLLGYPVVIDNNMPLATTGKRPLVFGAVADCFVIRTVTMRVEASRDALWNSDQTSFRAVWGLDSRVIDPTAVKALVMA